MVRVSHAPFIPAVRQPLQPISDLDLLLPRLQRSIQELEGARRRNEFEVNKLGVNIQYTRSLLTTLNKDAVGIQPGVRRMEIQSHLNEKRELLEGLEERHKFLQEAVLHDISDDDDDDDGNDGDSSSGEDLLSTIMETPSESMDGQSTNQLEEMSPVGRREEAQLPSREINNTSSTSEQHTNTSGTMRARTQAQPQTRSTNRPRQDESEEETTPQEAAAATSSRSYAPLPSGPSLVPPSLNPNPVAGAAATTHSNETAEELADRERQTQEAVSEALLQMARQLKASTQDIHVSLEEDKDILEKAGQGMDKTEGGMDGAQKRMKDLRTTQSGGAAWGFLGVGGLGGWMWEWKMYGIIALLWLMLVLLVFVGPKIRF